MLNAGFALLPVRRRILLAEPVRLPRPATLLALEDNQASANALESTRTTILKNYRRDARLRKALYGSFSALISAHQAADAAGRRAVLRRRRGGSVLSARNQLFNAPCTDPPGGLLAGLASNLGGELSRSEALLSDAVDVRKLSHLLLRHARRNRMQSGALRSQISDLSVTRRHSAALGSSRLTCSSRDAGQSWVIMSNQRR